MDMEKETMGTDSVEETSKAMPLEKIKLEKKHLIVGAIALIIIVLLLFISSRPEKLDLSTCFYNEIEVVGFNEHAQINEEYIFNNYQLEKSITALYVNQYSVSGEEAANMSQSDRVDAYIDGLEAADKASDIINEAVDQVEIIYYINGKEVEKLTNLANGDKVRLVATTNNYVIEDLNVQLADGEYELVVEGLTEGKEISVFEDWVKIEFGGASGTGYIIKNWLTDAKFPVYIEIEAFNNHKLKNGDQVVVEIDYNIVNLTEEGYYLKEDEKEFTVSGLPEYVTSEKELTEDIKNDIVNAALKAMNDDFQLIVMDADKITFDSMYFSVVQYETSGSQNAIYVYGKGVERDTGDTLYIRCAFNNVVIREDGSFGFEIFNDLEDVKLICNSRYDKDDVEEEVNSKEYYDFVKIK